VSTVPPRTSIEEINPPWDWHRPARYSAAIRAEGLLLVSGQVGITPDGEIAGTDFSTQARQALANVKAVLEAGGSAIERLVKVSWFLTDRANFAEVLDLRKEYFVAPYPADTTIVVAGLAREGLLVEIEAIAVAGPTLRGRVGG
jgi:reactive intermediate/imine deaminase